MGEAVRMVAKLDADVYVSHVDAMRLLADDAWLGLDDQELAALEQAGVDREIWALEFGHRLFSVDVARPGPPTTVDEAHARRGTFPEDDLRKLASSYVRRRVIPGGRRWSEELAPASVFTYERAESGPQKRDAATPFDGLLGRLVPDGDRIQIGPFRLFGALEVLPLLINAALQGVVRTLANVWRVLVLRDFDRYVLLRAVVGSAVIVGLVLLAVQRG
jgi:hypothetical protein